MRAVEVWSHESLRLAPGEAGPHLLLGLVFEESRRWEEAVSEYDLALAGPLAGGRLALIAEHRTRCQSQIPEW